METINAGPNLHELGADVFHRAGQAHRGLLVQDRDPHSRSKEGHVLWMDLKWQ